MNFVEMFAASSEDAKKELFALLNKKAMDALSNMQEGGDVQLDIQEEFDELTESRRLVDKMENGRHKATIHKDSELGEYEVKFHTDGKHLPEADYFTDDLADARGTAKTHLNGLSKWFPPKNQTNESVSDGNFFRMTNVDDGKMPWGSDKLPKDTSKHAYVKYVDGAPTEVKPHKNQDRVWNYKTGDMMSLGNQIKTWDGKGHLPLYKGKLIGSGNIGANE